MSFRTGIAAALALAAGLATVSSALADSRIFSATSGKPGVSVDQALINGQPLPVIGRGDQSTIFRIDSQIGPVPCTNHVVFVTSTDERVDFNGDFCQLNWQVTVAATEAAKPGPAVPPPSRLVAPGGKQSVMLITDDPKITITAVRIDRAPVAIVEKKDNSVRIEVVGGTTGITCTRDIGLDLSDGRSISRSLNICSNNAPIIIAVADTQPAVASSGPPAPPAPGALAPPPSAPPEQNAAGAAAPPGGGGPGTPGVASPAPMPPQTMPPKSMPPPGSPQAMPPPGGPQPVPPPVAGGPDMTAGMVWSFNGQNGNGVLAFGLPASDQTDFLANCQVGKPNSTVTLAPLAPGLRPGVPLSVTLSAGAFGKTYQGIGSPVSNVTGESAPQLSVPINDPLWQALISETSLIVSIGTAPPLSISLRGSASPSRQFLGACGAAAPVPMPPNVAGGPVPPAPIPGGQPPVVVGNPPPGRPVGYTCGNGTTLSITFAPGKASAYVMEPGAPPVLLYRAPSNFGDQFVAGPARLVGRDETVRWSRFGEPARVCRPNL